MGDKANRQLTQTQKAQLVGGTSFFGAGGEEKTLVRRIQLLDGGTGMNFEQLFGDMYTAFFEADSTNGMIGSTALTHVIDYYFEPEKLNADEIKIYEWIKKRLDERTKMPDYAPGCYPPGILLGATFSKEAVREVGRALGLEAALYGVDILLGSPNVNIHRDPLNGRLFEGYSEDPCVVSSLAPELVKGVQEYPVAANVKHFAANNQEMNRVGINEVISERALEEIYFPGFKACVQEGGVKTVMSAYNQINGTACSENYWLLTQKLRNEWGFDGVVMSDWGAVYHPCAAIAAGNDLAMPGPVDPKPVLKGLKEGALKEETLDVSVKRIEDLTRWIDAKKEQTVIEIDEDKIVAQTNRAAYQAAVEGIVLLKNERECFPITHESDRKIALLGTGSQNLIICGSGSAGITTNRGTSLLTELTKQLGEKYVQRKASCDELEEDADTILVVASLPGMEGNDRATMDLRVEDAEVLRESILYKKKHTGVKLGLILNVCGPVSLAEFEAELDGIFCMFLPGMQGGTAMADILTGKESPSGKLPLSFPKRYEDTPSCLNFPGDGYSVVYGEGIYVGYRYYDKKKVEPLYPFGYGLSYTQFEIKDCKTNCKEFLDSVNVTVTVKNTGNCAGAEVVQIYVADLYSTMPMPVKELKAFEKVHLNPGEEKTVSFHLAEGAFSYYDMDHKQFICEEGEYHILIGCSSDEKDIKMILPVYHVCESPYSYGLDSTIKVLYEKKELKEMLYAFWKKKNLDMGILESNYQYTSNRTLREIMPKQSGMEWEQDNELKEVLAKFRKIRKC